MLFIFDIDETILDCNYDFDFITQETRIITVANTQLKVSTRPHFWDLIDYLVLHNHEIAIWTKGSEAYAKAIVYLMFSDPLKFVWSYYDCETLPRDGIYKSDNKYKPVGKVADYFNYPLDQIVLVEDSPENCIDFPENCYIVEKYQDENFATDKELLYLKRDIEQGIYTKL